MREMSSDETFDWIVASILDHPSVYMGGPSKQSFRRAKAMREALTREGFVITPPQPNPIKQEKTDE